MSAVIKEVGYVLAHVPDFVQYGSKPSRDISENHDLLKEVQTHLRSYEEAVNNIHFS
jgi:betaine reductase